MVTRCGWRRCRWRAAAGRSRPGRGAWRAAGRRRRAAAVGGDGDPGPGAVGAAGAGALAVDGAREERVDRGAVPDVAAPWRTRPRRSGARRRRLLGEPAAGGGTADEAEAEDAGRPRRRAPGRRGGGTGRPVRRWRDRLPGEDGGVGARARCDGRSAAGPGGRLPGAAGEAAEAGSRVPAGAAFDRGRSTGPGCRPVEGGGVAEGGGAGGGLWRGAGRGRPGGGRGAGRAVRAGRLPVTGGGLLHTGRGGGTRRDRGCGGAGRGSRCGRRARAAPAQHGRLRILGRRRRRGGPPGSAAGVWVGCVAHRRIQRRCSPALPLAPLASGPDPQSGHGGSYPDNTPLTCWLRCRATVRAGAVGAPTLVRSVAISPLPAGRGYLPHASVGGKVWQAAAMSPHTVDPWLTEPATTGPPPISTRRWPSSTCGPSTPTPTIWCAARAASRSGWRASPCAAGRCWSGCWRGTASRGSCRFTLAESLWLARVGLRRTSCSPTPRRTGRASPSWPPTPSSPPP